MERNDFMETKLQQEINGVLKQFPEYWNEDKLLKNKLIEDIRAYNEKIIESLLSNKLIRDTYSLEVPSGVVFKVENFISMVRFKNYWDNSYTKYTNEIGLTSEGKYFKYSTDVVLDFPHKDGVLEGGMSKEDVGKREIYYHNVIAKEEIDTLLAPKVFTNIRKHDQNGERDIDTINEDDNLIVKGNNLLALHTLKEKYSEKVKVIYIDPPYNIGNDSFQYNDKFNHSTWLTFMKNRLEISKELLTNDGTIWISIDSNESHYLKVLADEVFGRENFVDEVIWQRSYAPVNLKKTFSKSHDTILVYAKSFHSDFELNRLPLSADGENRYKNPDNDSRGVWQSDNLSVGPAVEKNIYKIITPGGREVLPPSGRSWVLSKERFEEFKKDNRIWFGKDGNNVPRIKRFLSELKGGVVAQTLWTYQEVGHNQDAKRELIKIIGKDMFKTPKPEKLIQRIIQLASNEKDIVLDFFMGSATTQAVAHKMSRQYIGIEQMDYIQEVSIPRLQKVIEGEQGGISKDVDWQGGGSFVYAELYSLNEEYLQAIQGCSSNEELEHIINQMKQSAYLNFKVDLEKVTTNNEDFKSLSLKEQKDVLIQVLDMNQLYLNYSEIEDSQYDISDSVKAFNHAFYQKEGDTDE